MVELMFLKELLLTKQRNQKSAIFFIIVIFQIKSLRINQMSEMDAMIY